jgi:uncharacterized membrane protein YeiH
MDGLIPWSELGLQLLEWIATAAFALSGIVAAARKRMDVVGVCVVACLAAFGGGTLRDLLLDHRPFFWIRQQEALIGVFTLCLLAVGLMRQHHINWTERAIFWPDALGLGLFNASGIHLALNAGMPVFVAILMGVITGIFGGVLRDMVCNEIPATLRDHRPYAVCAFAGGVLYAGLYALGQPDALCMAACAAFTVGLRALAIWRNWSLKTWGQG